MGWDLGILDAFGVVVFLFGIRLVDFLDVCTPVLVQSSGFCILITAATFFLFRVPVRLLTHSGIKETFTLNITWRQILLDFVDHF